MTRDEVVRWATAYIDAPIDIAGGYPLWWAVSKFIRPLDGNTSAEDCWETILEVISRDPPDRVLAVLAAGPLEDLIYANGPDFIERIEAESARNPLFRLVLSGVYRSSTDEVWRRIKQCLVQP